MHFLFIDPSSLATRVIPVFLSRRLKVGVVMTQKQNADDLLGGINTKEVELFDLDKQAWNADVKVTSAVSWSKSGQEFLESISPQVALSNISNEHMRNLRNSQYIDSAVVENTIFIDTLSYKGRHVVMSVWKFIGEWKLFNDFQTPEFADAIEKAWANLDESGVINGPSQTYILPNDSIKLKFHPTNAAYAASRGLVNRHWIDIWPTVVEYELVNPKKSHNSYYDWVEKFGNSKRFTTQA